ncbi:hypothetical protein [Aestuariimicrobium sp. Y1814]|uniref:hypothetical protein n=1 Tax=Aestuariimicrobium sp. Y1814 TaxID=3418742 RepID=UPI003DA6D479
MMARRALDSLRATITDAVSPAVVGLADAPNDGIEPAVLLTPVALRRVGRSRRHGALLDLELTVAVLTRGPDALDHLESLLVLAETTGLTATPADSAGDQPGLGLTLTLPVTVPLDEPTGPPVETVVVELQPTTSPPEGN